MTNPREWTSRLAELLAREHAALAEFLIALADFDERRLWVDLGYASVFDFLHRELGLSKGAAHYRKVAARLVAQYPDLVEPLRDGRLCLSSVVELARVITPENRSDVLPRFFHCSKQEAREVSAELSPRPRVPARDVVTAPALSEHTESPTAAGAGAAAPARQAPTDVPSGSRQVEVARAFYPDESRSRRPSVAPRDEVEPVTGQLRRLHVTVSRRFLDKLDAARAGLSHARPGATTEEVLEAALDLLLAAQGKRRGIVKRPRRGSAPVSRTANSFEPAPRHVPAAARREVWTRDGARCQWPLATGGVCGSSLRPELDHQVPLALGGASAPANLRVLCRFHNDVSARRQLGDGVVEDQCARSRARARGGGRSATAGARPAGPTPNVSSG